MAEDAAGYLAEILAEYGPLTEDDIAQRLRDAGVADPEAALDEILETDCPLGQLVDTRWVWLPMLLAEKVFTHRLTADELAHDFLAVTPDLDPITALCEHEQYARFVGGSQAEVVLPEFDDERLEQQGIPPEVVAPSGALLLAPGTLRALGVTEGDLVGVRLTERGLAVDRATAHPHAAVGAGLAATLNGEPVLIDAAVWTTCVEDPTAFTEPLPPLSEIVENEGLARSGDWLAPGGFDFARWYFEQGCAMLAELHDLEAGDAFALYTLVKLYEQIALELTLDEPANLDLPDFTGELGAALAEPYLAELLVSETIDRDDDGTAALHMFAEALEPKVPRAARVACRWLRAVALERSGDIDAAERELLAAESMDPDNPLPLLGLARIASDRGDAERGLALLRRAGAEPDHPLVDLLERHRSAPRSDVGRNELCWCGSGRKYKKCHLGREQLALAERADWLYAKAIQHALQGDWSDLLTEVSYERCRYQDNDQDTLRAALDDPLVLDAMLFEGGALEEFLAIRGSLLPDDERLLAEQWLLAGRSVFEIERVQPGQGVTVRDVRTGDTCEVQERTASRQLKAGQLICSRVLPVGDSMQFFGGVEPVALHERDALIELLDSEPHPAMLVAQLSRRFAPPTLTNTEGDPLMICEATIRVGDPSGIEAALDDTYDRVDDSLEWFEHVTTHGMQRIRATLMLDGDTMRIETNSGERMDRVMTTLRRLDPAMRVLGDSREAVELSNKMSDTDEDELDDDDPKVAAALEEFICDYETRWLDKPLPALDGHTPRQAADDPTRRGDLIKLLDSFPAAAGTPGRMDADRLRAALGL